jgi:outer membrane protein assembly factor BamB
VILQLVLVSLSFGLPELVDVQPIPKTTWQSSVSGNYQYHIRYGAEAPGEIPIEHFALKDRNGVLLWEKELPGQEAFYVSDAGSVVGLFGSGPNARLTFFDRTGKVVARQGLPFAADGRFSVQGLYFYVNSGQGVLAYDGQGRLQHRFGPASCFQVSDDDRLMATARGNEARLHVTGRLRAQLRLSSPYVRGIAFSPDGARLAIAERAGVTLYATSDGTELWHVDFDPAEVSLLTPAADNQGTVYLGVEPTATRAGSLVVVSKGTETERLPIAYHTDSETITGILVCDGRIQVRTSDYLFTFQSQP